MTYTREERMIRLHALARRAWPYAKNIEIQNGLKGSDPYCIFVRVDGDIMLDIDCNEHVFDALEAALPVLAGLPAGDKLLEGLRLAFDEIHARKIKYEDVDLKLTLGDNARKLGVSPETVAAILDVQKGQVPLWAVELASTWSLLAGPGKAAALDESPYKGPHAVPPTPSDEVLAAYFKEHPEELAGYFSSTRWHMAERERQLLRKHAHELLKAARTRR